MKDGEVYRRSDLSVGTFGPFEAPGNINQMCFSQNIEAEAEPDELTNTDVCQQYLQVFFLDMYHGNTQVKVP